MNLYLIILTIIFIIISLIFIILYNKNKIYKKKYQEYQLCKQDLEDFKNNKQKYIAEIDKLNIETNNLNNKVENIKKQYDEKRTDLEVLEGLVDKKTEKLDQLDLKVREKTSNYQKEINNQKEKRKQELEQFKKVSYQAMNSYVDTLQHNYQEAETKYNNGIVILEQEYNKTNNELEQLKATKKAAYQAILREEQIKRNKDYYRLVPTTAVLQDIHTLQNIRYSLTKPRILSMLIWQTYFQPIAKEKFPIILQDKTKTGIYKITNILTNQCYIGQSVDIYKRWCDHCKAGIGIDTPVGNKLYQAIKEDGLENFTFELLCECSKQELDEKEAYFIDLYQADLYGYNSTVGNKK